MKTLFFKVQSNLFSDKTSCKPLFSWWVGASLVLTCFYSWSRYVAGVATSLNFVDNRGKVIFKCSFFVCVCFFFRFGEDWKPAAAREWGYLQTSLWDYWSVLFRRWCKFSTKIQLFLGFPCSVHNFCCDLTMLFVLFRLMKIPTWSLTPLKEGPSTLIQLPTCKRRSLISKRQNVWFDQLHGYSVITPDIHPSLLQPGNLVPKDLLGITSTWKLTTEGFTNLASALRGVFFVVFFFVVVFFIFGNGHPSLNMATLHWSPGHSTGTSPSGNLHQEDCQLSLPVLQNISHK